MNIAALIKLHKEVIHDAILGHKGKCEGVSNDDGKDVQGTYDPACSVCLEDKWVKTYPSDSLVLVCSPCFKICSVESLPQASQKLSEPIDLISKQTNVVETQNKSIKCIVFPAKCQCENRYPNQPTSFLAHVAPGRWQPRFQVQ